MRIGKRVPERRAQRHVREHGVHVVLFPDGTGRDHQQDDADERVDAEGRAPRPQCRQSRALEQAHDQRTHIAERAARHEEERADRVGIDSQRSVLDQLGDERVVRDHVEREEEVVPPHERRDPHGVEPADLAERDEEHEQRTQTERDGGLFHQRDPAAVGVPALVGAGRDERVGDGVDDVTDGLDQPDNRENPQHDPPLRDEIGDSRFFGRLIKIDEVVVEHGRKQPAANCGRHSLTISDVSIFSCHLEIYLFDLMYLSAQMSSPFAMALGSSRRASKQLPMPWSPHMAMSHSLAISSSLQPAFCQALTSGQ